MRLVWLLVLLSELMRPFLAKESDSLEIMLVNSSFFTITYAIAYKIIKKNRFLSDFVVNFLWDFVPHWVPRKNFSISVGHITPKHKNIVKN